jgi:hypothetical protein
MVAAFAAVLLAAGQVVAAPFTISAVGTVVATDGALSTVPVGHQIAGDWTVDTVFGNGLDDNDGIPTPEYDVQITFGTISYAEVRDGSGAPVPTQNVMSSGTSLYYNDDETILAADLVGSVAEGLVGDGVHDIFELNAVETFGVQDPITGEYSPFAPPGTGTALEVVLVVLGDSTWFSGAPSQLLAAQPGVEAFIFVTEYDESGLETGHIAAVADTLGPTAPAAVPLPAGLWLMVGIAGLAGIAARRQNHRR